MNGRANIVKRVGLLAWLVTLGVASISAADFRGGPLISDWLFLGPVVAATNGGETVTAAVGVRDAFERDLLASVGGETNVNPRADYQLQLDGVTYRWSPLTGSSSTVPWGSEAEPSVSRVGYAWAEVVTPGPTNALLGVGSDDAVRAWLNGNLILQKSLRRPLRPDDDLISVGLLGGTNQLLLKFQSAKPRFGFTCRFLNASNATSHLLDAVAGGNLERVRKLLSHGANPNRPDASGMAPLMAARIHGYEQIAGALEGKGADASVALPPAGRVIDGILGRIVQGDSPGAAVLVARYGRVIFESGYGYASVEHRVPVTPGTVFRIGTLTMPFTAAAVLLLQEQGKLNVTERLSSYLPAFPWGDEVTLTHLLTHTSGIHSYTDRPDYNERSLGPAKPEELLSTMALDIRDFRPGEGWRFGSSGYFLLGRLVEDLTGRPYADVVRTRLFIKAGMTNTGVYRWDTIIENEASGYVYEPRQGYSKAPNRRLSWAGGAGAMQSTVRDLHLWARSLFAGEILDKTSMKLALTPVRLANGKAALPSGGYGLGWFIRRFRGLDLVEHGGNGDGFQSHLVHYPKNELTVVVLANASPAPAGLDASVLASEIAQLFLYEEMDPREPGSN